MLGFWLFHWLVLQLFRIGPTESMCVSEESGTDKTSEVWWWCNAFWSYLSYCNLCHGRNGCDSNAFSCWWLKAFHCTCIYLFILKGHLFFTFLPWFWWRIKWTWILYSSSSSSTRQILDVFIFFSWFILPQIQEI